MTETTAERPQILSGEFNWMQLITEPWSVRILLHISHQHLLINDLLINFESLNFSSCRPLPDLHLLQLRFWLTGGNVWTALHHLVHPCAAPGPPPSQHSHCCCKLDRTNGTLLSAVFRPFNYSTPMFLIQPTTESVKTVQNTVTGGRRGVLVCRVVNGALFWRCVCVVVLKQTDRWAQRGGGAAGRFNGDAFH